MYKMSAGLSASWADHRDQEVSQLVFQHTRGQQTLSLMARSSTQPVGLAMDIAPEQANVRAVKTCRSKNQVAPLVVQAACWWSQPAGQLQT
jgi:hypothetical protein